MPRTAETEQGVLIAERVKKRRATVNRQHTEVERDGGLRKPERTQICLSGARRNSERLFYEELMCVNIYK